MNKSNLPTNNSVVFKPHPENTFPILTYILIEYITIGCVVLQ